MPYCAADVPARARRSVTCRRAASIAVRRASRRKSMERAGIPGNALSASERTRAPLVAVVEDDLTQRSLLSRALRDEGYEVIGSSDGEIGLQTIIEHAPDLVLLDLSLPRMNGFEV